MLNIDSKSLEKLKNPDIELKDRLYLIARYIEAKYKFQSQPNYWENRFNDLQIDERIFYKVWLWLNYIEDENLISPIVEYEQVYGLKMKNELEEFLNKNIDSHTPNSEIETVYHLNGEAGQRLITWAISKLVK